jgi:hypothetical protein
MIGSDGKVTQPALRNKTTDTTMKADCELDKVSVNLDVAAKVRV